MNKDDEIKDLSNSIDIEASLFVKKSKKAFSKKFDLNNLIRTGAFSISNELKRILNETLVNYFRKVKTLTTKKTKSYLIKKIAKTQKEKKVIRNINIETSTNAFDRNYINDRLVSNIINDYRIKISDDIKKQLNKLTESPNFEKAFKSIEKNKNLSLEQKEIIKKNIKNNIKSDKSLQNRKLIDNIIVKTSNEIDRMISFNDTSISYLKNLVLNELKVNSELTALELKNKIPELAKVWSDNRLQMIADTEGTRIANQKRLEIYKNSDGFIDSVEFIAVMDKRTTVTCQTRNGTILRIDDPRLPDFTPPLHVRCRSLLSGFSSKYEKNNLTESNKINNIIVQNPLPKNWKVS